MKVEIDDRCLVEQKRVVKIKMFAYFTHGMIKINHPRLS